MRPLAQGVRFRRKSPKRLSTRFNPYSRSRSEWRYRSGRVWPARGHSGWSILAAVVMANSEESSAGPAGEVHGRRGSARAAVSGWRRGRQTDRDAHSRKLHVVYDLIQMKLQPTAERIESLRRRAPCTESGTAAAGSEGRDYAGRSPGGDWTGSAAVVDHLRSGRGSHSASIFRRSVALGCRNPAPADRFLSRRKRWCVKEPKFKPSHYRLVPYWLLTPCSASPATS